METTARGWIKLHRRLLDDAVCQKSAYFHLWVTLLLTAAHRECEFIFNNQIRKLKPGQLITGRKKLAKRTGIPETTVRRILKCFENGHMIQQEMTSKFRLITVINWENYQSEPLAGKDGGHQMANKRPSGGHQAATYKNDKNDKNDKNLSLREDFSDEQGMRDNARYANDPVWQDTERKLRKYEDEQKRIQAMLQRTNP